MLDLPGIIEGAHEGKGLGLQFLRHIERNQILLFVVSCEGDIIGEYETLRDELSTYDSTLLTIPRILAISKTDLRPPDADPLELPEESGLQIIQISSATGAQISELKELIWKQLSEIKDE